MGIKRSDKQKNVDKVAAARLENPTASQREIAEATGVSKSSVDRADKELGQIGAKYPEIEQFIAGDLRILKAGQLEMEERVTDPSKKEKINDGDLNRILDSAQKRYSFFQGDVTDEKGGEKIKPSEEQQIIANALIDKYLGEGK